MCWYFKKRNRFKEFSPPRPLLMAGRGVKSSEFRGVFKTELLTLNSVLSRRDQCGFILIEAVLSVVIIAVSLTLILQSFTGAYRAAALNVDYTKALILLENQMSLITRTGFIEAGARQEGDDHVPLERFHYDLEAEPSLSDVKGEINQVKLNIAWKSGVNSKHISLITYLLKPPDEKK